MAKVKVFIGTKFVDGKQARVLIATTSKKRVSEIANITLGEVNNFFTVTANETDIERAMQKQEALIVKEWVKK
jgi:hypothetical protein